MTGVFIMGKWKNRQILFGKSLVLSLIGIMMCGLVATDKVHIFSARHVVAAEISTENIEETEDLEKESADDEMEKPYVELYAGAAALLDADSGRVLYEKNGYEPKAMASTTKIMTCILALELGDLNSTVTFSANAASKPDVQMNGKEGEQYYLKDLLYSLMLESHNDTAVAIAEHIGGSEEGFAALMNEKAVELGAYDTHFVTANGLDAEGHYTTACDLGRIACYAIRNPQFLEIIQTPAHSFQEINGARSVAVTNRDAFLTSYDGALGIKTGFTGEAGYCFVGAARRENKTLVSVVLASGWPPHKSYKWSDTRTLMDFGMCNYEPTTIIGPDYELPKITIQEGIECESVPVYIEDSRCTLLGKHETVQYEEHLPEVLEAPVCSGDIAGTVDIYISGEFYDSVVVYIGGDVARINYPYVFRKLVREYFLLST